MNKAIGIALLVVGVILLIWGINSSETVGSQLSESLTGKPTEKTVWMIVGGVVSGLTGLGLLLFTGSRPSGPA